MQRAVHVCVPLHRGSSYPICEHNWFQNVSLEQQHSCLPHLRKKLVWILCKLLFTLKALLGFLWVAVSAGTAVQRDDLSPSTWIGANLAFQVQSATSIALGAIPAAVGYPGTFLFSNTDLGIILCLNKFEALLIPSAKLVTVPGDKRRW